MFQIPSEWRAAQRNGWAPEKGPLNGSPPLHRKCWLLLYQHQLVAPALTLPSKILFTSAPCWDQLYELRLFHFCSDRDPFPLLFFTGNVFLEVKIVSCSGPQHAHWGSQELCYYFQCLSGSTFITALRPVLSFRSLNNVLNTREVTVQHKEYIVQSI